MHPFVLDTGGFQIPSYYLVNSIAFSIGVIWVFFRARKKDLNADGALDMALALMLGGFVGARITHILVEQPTFYLAHPSFVLRFWNGGFVYYGGAILGTAGAWFVCKKKNMDFFKYADLFAPVAALSYAIGRLGCFLAGCCYGHSTNLPWAVQFPRGVEAPAGIPLHPTQLYATLWELGVMAILLVLEKKWRKRQFGQIFGLWLVLHGLGRAVMEHFRDDFRGVSLFNLSISTWISGLVILGGIWIMRTAPIKKRT